MSFHVIVLAGGVGKRMKSDKSKIMHLVMGKPMVHWVIENAKAVSPSSITLIYSKKGKEVEGLFPRVDYVLQPEPLGTGDAVSRALNKIEDKKGDVLILSADVPLLSNDTLERLITCHKENDYAATFLTFKPSNPFGYGRIIRDGQEIIRIVEEKDASEEEKKIREVNGGVYIFSLATLRNSIELIKPVNAQIEYYLTDVISIIQKRGGKITGVITDNPSELQGINTRSDLTIVIESMRKRKIRQLQEEGVTILAPWTVYIEPQVEIGRDTIIEPNVVITGNTFIGINCVIGPFVHLVDQKISSGSKIGN